MDAPCSYQFRWVLPISGPPIENGFVNIAGDRVLGVSAEPFPSATVRVLGNRIVLPRLVNAHTHLEFSSLDQPFAATDGFPAWVREVIKWRQQRDGAFAVSGFTAQSQAISRGVDESLGFAVGVLGEIATAPWPAAAYSENQATVVFLEQLGVLPSQAAERLAAVNRRVEELLGSASSRSPSIGLSPHAPYSLSESLFSGMLDLSQRFSLPVAMHLAETKEEVDWLGGAENGFSALQTRLGVPVAEQWRPSFTWFLQQLARTSRALVIHGNYLRLEHWRLLAENRERMSVVWCPRTHQHFAHSTYPIEGMLSAGVRVAVGTDSRASNPNLDLLDELRLVRRLFPSLPPQEILKLGTLNGAEALGLAERFGQLIAGADARLATIECADDCRGDPAGWLLDCDGRLERFGPDVANF